MKPSDFIVEHNPFIAQDADEMHRDNEVQMARSDLYASADYAIKLHKILRGISDSADMEQWVMEKIAIANENLRTVYEYLNYEAREQEGAMPAFQFESAEEQFDSIMEGEGHAALKKVKNSYNQAAKDAGGDWVGAGKKIDNMKKSLRAKDVGKDKSANEVNEGVAETVPMADAMKVLRQYGADNFKTTSNELHFYKQGRPFSVDFVMNPDATRSVTLSSLNSASRGLKGQGVAESCNAGATGASSIATGAVGAIVPQRRVKQESAATKKYGNAMKTKAPKIGKGVY